MLRRLLLYTANALMILLAPPALGILATWNTLPGELLYPVKRGLESTALFVLSPSFQAKSSLHSELISRRTSEATRLLAVKNSTQGLKELQAEIAAARIQFEDPNLDAATKQKAAQQMITKLQATDQALQKAGQSSSPPPKRTVPSRTDAQPATPQTIYIYQEAPPAQIQTQTEIRQTQIIIKQTIIQIQREAENTNQDQDQDRDNDNDRNDRGGSRRDRDNDSGSDNDEDDSSGNTPSQTDDSTSTDDAGAPDSTTSTPDTSATNQNPDKPADTPQDSSPSQP